MLGCATNRDVLLLTTLQYLKRFICRYVTRYCKVASRSTSQLVAYTSMFRMFMKGKFDAYLLWNLTKSFQNKIVDRSTICDFTVCNTYYVSTQNVIDCPLSTCNVCFKKTGTKRSSNTLLRLVPVFLKQTLCST